MWIKPSVKRLPDGHSDGEVPRGLNRDLVGACLTGSRSDIPVFG